MNPELLFSLQATLIGGLLFFDFPNTLTPHSATDTYLDDRCGCDCLALWCRLPKLGLLLKRSVVLRTNRPEIHRRTLEAS